MLSWHSQNKASNQMIRTVDYTYTTFLFLQLEKPVDFCGSFQLQLYNSEVSIGSVHATKGEMSPWSAQAAVQTK